MSTQYVCMHFSHMLKHVWTCWFWTCWYVLWNLWINLQYSAHLLKKNSAPRTRASPHLRGWRAVGRLWHSNAQNACPWPGWPGWPRQWKVGLSQCLCVSSSYSSYSSYNLHVRHKVGFFVIFMILLILSILRSWVIFKIRGRQAPVATFLCFFFVFFSRSLDFLPSAFCPLCSLVMIIMFPVPDMFFPLSFSVRAHRVINGTPTRGLDWCIDHLLDARLAPRCSATQFNRKILQCLAMNDKNLITTRVAFLKTHVLAFINLKIRWVVGTYKLKFEFSNLGIGGWKRWKL